MAGHRVALSDDLNGIKPFPLAPGAGDAAVLDAVIEHYRSALERSDSARLALRKLAIDGETAMRFRVGYSDRTLGLRMPGRRWKHGEELRSQLIRLGVYRDSGHEHFVGCLVVPIFDSDERIIGLTGRRIDRHASDLFANGLVGGWFNEQAIGDGVLVASSVFEALAVISAGHSSVIAIGHGGPITRADARRLANQGVRQATLSGPLGDEIVERFSREGIECTRMALHRNAQRLLESLPVVIPDAASIDFPDFATRHRRDQQKLISLIAAITLLHQHQRKTATVEVGGHEIAYVEASSEDVALGLALSSEVLLRGADELAPQARRLLDVMRTGSDERTAAGAKLVAFTRRELRELTGWSEHQVRVGLERLVILEYVEERRDRPGLRHTYVLVDADLAGVRGTPREARDPEVRGDFGDPAGRTDHLASCTSIDSEESPDVGADWIVGAGRRDRSVW